jgi:hypothetical protein
MMVLLKNGRDVSSNAVVPKRLFSKHINYEKESF